MESVPVYDRATLDALLVQVVGDLYRQGIMAFAHDGVLGLSRWPHYFDAPVPVLVACRVAVAEAHRTAGFGGRRFLPCWRHSQYPFDMVCDGMTPVEVVDDPMAVCLAP